MTVPWLPGNEQEEEKGTLTLELSFLGGLTILEQINLLNNLVSLMFNVKMTKFPFENKISPILSTHTIWEFISQLAK